MPSVYSPRWVEPEEPITRYCEVEGCSGAGMHKAPKSRYSAENKDYHWFCVDHVRQYNESWNYFSGMTDAEMEDFWRESSTPDGRPTWKRERKKAYSRDDLHESVRRTFADYLSGRESDYQHRRIAPIDKESQQSLAVLDLKWPVTEEEIKSRYKILVKQYHPDVNQDESAEEFFKKFTIAYQQLRQALKRLKEE